MTQQIVMELTPDEERIIRWLRSAKTKRSHHWMGTIRWTETGRVQLFVSQPVRQIDRRSDNT